MARSDRWVKGTYNVIDDLSGRKLKASQCRKRWDGLLVANEDWEPRHPQDFLRSRRDDQRVPVPRPDSDQFERNPVTPDDL